MSRRAVAGKFLSEGISANRMSDKLLDSRKCHGFSLIEMAIVLVIVMSVLTLGLGALSSIMTSSAHSETKARQTRIKDALTAYLGANQRLPCPNIPVIGTIVSGVENINAAGCSGVLGVVPYVTLGLSRDAAEDGWGNLISYQVYVAPTPACPASPTTGARTGIDWSNAACFGSGKSGGIEIRDGLASSPTAIANGVAAVLVSHGQNGLRAWSRQGTRNAAPTTCEEAHNSLFVGLGGCALTANRFFKGERSGNDDVVAYLTADDIIQALAKQGAILSAAAQVAEDLRINMQDAIGRVRADGSNYSLSTLSPAYLPITTDPWGSPYQIFPHISSISTEGFVTPTAGAASAICIYSFGPNLVDGVPATPTLPAIPTTTTTCTAGGDDIAASISPPALTTLLGCSPTSPC